MKVIYIAGPFRGNSSWDIEQNIRRAETLALEVWRLGAACLCPHTNTRFFQGAADDEVWLKGDLELLRRCDAVLMTDDWEKSSGARAEALFAARQSIPVFLSLGGLKAWLDVGDKIEPFDKTPHAKNKEEAHWIRCRCKKCLMR